MEITFKFFSLSVYTSFLLQTYLAIAQAGNIVPVMLWSPRTSNDLINPFQKTTSFEFEKILTDQLGKDQLPIVIFVKENFCIEEIKHYKKSLEQLSIAGTLTYLTSVESPTSVFENLSTYNITIENDLESINEGQLALLQIRNINVIPEIYNILRESNSGLIVGVTGKICSYSSSERTKREIISNIRTKSFIIKHKEILLYADKNPSIKFPHGQYIQLGNPIETLSVKNKNMYYLIMIFDNVLNRTGKINLTAHFSEVNGYFQFIGFRLHERGLINTELFLKSRHDIYYPFNFSYHCIKDIIFISKFEDSTLLLKISNMQIQMDPIEDRFNDAYDCVGFMSIPIWTGIFVIVILLIIMIWGLTMIIDIRTMDHFDDPKGKTITISAQE